MNAFLLEVQTGYFFFYNFTMADTKIFGYLNLTSKLINRKVVEKLTYKSPDLYSDQNLNEKTQDFNNLILNRDFSKTIQKIPGS